MLLLPLLSRFSRVRLCATPWTAAHQSPPSLGFSRQEHWSGLPFPSPMRESEVPQSCPTLRDPMDCSLPGSSVHGTFQARVLEWGAIAFSAVPATHIQPTPMTSHPGILRRTWSKVPLHGSPICLRPYQHVRGPPLTVLSRGGKGQG